MLSHFALIISPQPRTHSSTHPANKSMNWEKHFLILVNKASIWGEVLYSIPKTNKKAKGEKPTIFWTIPHFTTARSSTWQLITQFWVIDGWACKGNQIIHVWELDPIKCLDSTTTFTLIYSIGQVFVVSELFMLWIMLPLKGPDSIHAHVTVSDLCCFSPSLAALFWSTVTLWGCVQFRCLLILIATVSPPVCSDRSKNLKNWFNLLLYAYVFIYGQQMH